MTVSTPGWTDGQRDSVKASLRELGNEPLGATELVAKGTWGGAEGEASKFQGVIAFAERGIVLAVEKGVFKRRSELTFLEWPEIDGLTFETIPGLPLVMGVRLSGASIGEVHVDLTGGISTAAADATLEFARRQSTQMRKSRS